MEIRREREEEKEKKRKRKRRRESEEDNRFSNLSALDSLQFWSWCWMGCFQHGVHTD